MIAKDRNKEAGTALVEFVLVVPLFLLLMFGITEFSILLYDKAVITNASREAAREWIEYTESKLNSASLEQIVENYTSERLITFDNDNSKPNPLNTSFEINGTSATDTTAYTSGDSLRVIVSYDYDWLLLPDLASNALPDVTLSAETAMRAE